MNVLVAWLVGLTLVAARPQVNQEIDSEEDLLAVDSFENEVSVSVPILPPPPGFAGLGDRLQKAPTQQTALRGPLQQAASAGGAADVRAVVYNNKMNNDGSYAFNYETNDGQSRQEQGQIGANGGMSQTGGWQYVIDGKTYGVTFVADENGYRPVGLHLPTPPPMPAALARFFNPHQPARSPKALVSRRTKSSQRGRRRGSGKGVRRARRVRVKAGKRPVRRRVLGMS
jgi:hypothetical protein